MTVVDSPLPTDQSHRTIDTSLGKPFDLLNPEENEYHIQDIATGLSNTCRFNGQLPCFYSVAQHSVLVAMEAQRIISFDRACFTTAQAFIAVRLIGLLHDAHEAYLGDIPRPHKGLFKIKTDDGDKTFSEIEDMHMQAIFKTLNLEDLLPSEATKNLWEYVDEADKNAVFQNELLFFKPENINRHPQSLFSQDYEWYDPKYPEAAFKIYHNNLLESLHLYENLSYTEDG